MFAIIRTGGKQYRVAKDDKLEIERLNAKDGDSIDLDVLFLSDGKTIKTGEPLVSGASVKAKVLGEVRGPKITIFKKKRRQNYRRKKGHRQDLTLIQITDIKAA
jgi:large subunit ribosomal protein L21